MSTKNGKDYLYLIWKHPDTRRQYIVGTLSKNGLFEFKYGEEFTEAQKEGFKGIEAFKEFDKTYTSEKLFPVFSSRLPDKKRKGISEILKKYNLYEYDEYMLLKNSGARLPIDTLEFIDPIFDNEQPVSRYFYVAGARHHMPCCGEECTKKIDIKENEKLILCLEPENPYDENAVIITTSNNQVIGYIPRYYSKQVTKMIKDNRNVTCTVIEFNKSIYCRECVKVNLYIE